MSAKFLVASIIEKLKEKSLTSVYIHAGLALSLAFLSALMFYYVYLPLSTYHGQTITVPDLRGMKENEIAQFLKERDLRYEISDSNYVENLPAGTVISQIPEAGQQVKINRKIYLTINTQTAPEVNLPDIFDVSRKNAELILKSIGLKIGQVEYQPDLAVNAVLKLRYNQKIFTREDQRKGIKIPKGAVIDLIVGDGLGTVDIEIPDVTGMLLTEAEEVLIGLGISIGTIKYIKSEDETGTVLSQLPIAEKGVKIRIGSTIDLTVAGFEPKNN